MKNGALLQFWRPGKHDFLRGMLSAFGDASGSGGSFAPPRYPRDAQQQDMVRIGRDMRRAMGVIHDEVCLRTSNGTKRPSEPSAGADHTRRPASTLLRVHNDPRESVMESATCFESIPSPAMLAKYEEVLPGGAERIVRMVETERNHQRDREIFRISGAAREINRGQWMGLAIVVASVLCATFLAMNDKVMIAGILGAIGFIGGTAGIFLGRES